MKKVVQFALFMGLTRFLCSVFWGQDCSVYNQGTPVNQELVVDNQEHLTGNHYVVTNDYGSCTYSRPGYNGWCTVLASMGASGSANEAGILTTIVDQHVPGYALKTSRATGINGASANAYSEGAGSIMDCFDGLCTAHPRPPLPRQPSTS